jgi:hypothetical protein
MMHRASLNKEPNANNGLSIPLMAQEFHETWSVSKTR